MNFVGLMRPQAPLQSGSLVSHAPAQTTVCFSAATIPMVTTTVHTVKMLLYSVLEVSNYMYNDNNLHISPSLCKVQNIHFSTLQCYNSVS